MKPARAWQRMLSGRQLDLLNPAPTDIEIQDIARGLAFVARWNGQTVGDHPYSVAEHSLLVEELFSRRNTGTDTNWRLAALLHDAAEYVIGDMISPVKNALGNEFRVLEARIGDAVRLRFGLPLELPTKIQREIRIADRTSAWLEATQIAGFDQTEADQLFGRLQDPAIAKIRIAPLAAEKARRAFVQRCNALSCKPAAPHAASTKQAARSAMASALSPRRKKSANPVSGIIR